MPDIFLSYSRDDSLTMGYIRDNLRKLGFNLWIDIEHLKPGTPQWERAVKRAVGKTDGMLVLCSPAAEKSEWVSREIHMARVARKPIVPVLITGEEWDAIPAALMGDQYCDMRGSSGPEHGFRMLVAWLAEQFDFHVPEYTLRSSGGVQAPALQVINIQGHVEGHVIVIGRDVEGYDDEVSGGIRRQEIVSPRSPPVREHAPTPERGQRQIPARQHRASWLNEPRAIIIAAIITGVLGIVGAVIGTGLFGLGGGGRTTPPAPDMPTAIVATEGAEQRDEQAPDAPLPAVTASPTPEPTAGPAIALARAGVSSNDEWTPYIENFGGVQMALVPAGCFMMGSEDGESDEQPAHEVCFDEPYWIDVTEVTNAQFGSEGAFSGGDRPRESVDWFEAVAHCEGRGARLPTEAEWEYAARGPDGLIYPWGTDFVGDNVVYSGNSGGQTAKVGSRAGGASWVGALDVSGNVWEWVSSIYWDYPYVATDGREVGGSSDSSSARVLRGGSWYYSYSGGLRAASRAGINPGNSVSYLGFRCARSF